uniref:Uncharacterized protein n=1 Tax=Anguilla anguilla TaxID=7936 RepID=A0A0E9QT87_ANGAN
MTLLHEWYVFHNFFHEINEIIIFKMCFCLLHFPLSYITFCPKILKQVWHI